MSFKSREEANRYIKKLEKNNSVKIISKKEANKIITPNIKLNFEFSKPEAISSMIKSLLAVANEININCYDFNSILSNKDGNLYTPFKFFYDKDLISNRETSEILHCVNITGNSATNSIIGYVEYFSFYRYIFCISTDYYGDDFKNTYTINPLTGKELDLIVKINLTPEEISEILSPTQKNTDAIINQYFHILSQIQYTSHSQLVSTILNKCLEEYARQNNIAKEDTLINSKEDCLKIANLAAKYLTPLLISRNNMKK